MGSIVVENVGKAYKHYESQWGRLAEWMFPWRPARHQESWVLRDVSFGVMPGEAVGILGINGAGKSTLLKIITGTTQPTTGSVRLDGHVAALLELGMGFHPDFTGRQNVYMAGQLLGLGADDISVLMPAIEAFAEIGHHIDHPVRTYSSGMQMRLAFSVATARRPDVLVVDEALSVGDAYFQHKSFDRIRQFRKEGTTLLIVSHDRNAIQSVCDRAILLDGGRLAMQGRPEDVFDYYNALLSEREEGLIRQEALDDGRLQTISGTGDVGIVAVALHDAGGRSVTSVSVGESVSLVVRARVRNDVPRLILGFMIKDKLGQPVYGINTHRTGQALSGLKAGEEVVFRFDFSMRIGVGHYSVALALSPYDSHIDKNYEWRDHSMIFHVTRGGSEDFVGVAWLDAKATVERLP